MSEAYSLSGVDFQKWTHNLFIFLAPVVLIYLAFVAAAISSANGAFSLSVFVPNSIVIGAMVLYVLNGLTDIIRKFVPDTTVQGE
jgi:hypothetical protein